MRVYLDTEFVDTGRTIELISIGLVADDGNELYRINASGNAVGAAVNHSWLSEHVVPWLPVKIHHRTEFPPEEQKLFEYLSAGNWYTWDESHPEYEFVKPGDQIRQDVHTFLSRYKNVELWADHGAYDHVALAQLFGRMIDLPKAVPMFTCELRQEWVRLGKPTLPKQTHGVHHALHDARHDKVIGSFLKDVESKLTEPVEVQVDLKGSQLMSDDDMDHFVSKVSRKLTQNLLPNAGLKVRIDPLEEKDVPRSPFFIEPVWQYRITDGVRPWNRWREITPGQLRGLWAGGVQVDLEFRRKPPEGE